MDRHENGPGGSRAESQNRNRVMGADSFAEFTRRHRLRRDASLRMPPLRDATADPLGVVAPNEVRINGHPVLADENITIHETEIIGGRSRDVVRVTLTLFARRVRIEAQPEGGDA